MRPQPFDYVRPRTVRDAIAAAGEAGTRAAYLAGGQDLVPRMNRGERSPAVVIDLKGVDDLDVRPDSSAVGIGALATHHRLSRAQGSPWAAMVGRLGPGPVRSRATVGGHLVTGASFWPVLLAALDGQVELADTGGRRRLGAAEAVRAVRTGHAIVCGVLVPRSEDLVGVSGSRGHAGAAGAVAGLTCAVRIRPDHDGRVAGARVVIGANGEPPRRLVQVEDALRGRRVPGLADSAPPGLVGSLIAAASRALAPMSQVGDPR